MNKPLSNFSADDEKRFVALLPWYVNGTLDEPDRSWVESISKASNSAALLLAEHEAFCNAVQALARPQPLPQPTRWKTGWTSTLDSFRQWLSQPQWAVATACLVIGQVAIIGWQAASHDDYSLYKSTPVSEARTLRVTFVASASESQIRAALTGARARIVGGPTQLGEYWVASGTLTLDELKAALLKSGIAERVEVDLSGPRGQ